MLKVATVASFAPGPIGMVGNVVAAVGNVAKGNYGTAAIHVFGAVTWGVGRYTSVIGRAIQRSPTFGVAGTLFGRHKLGLLNSNDYVRLGWSWMGGPTGANMLGLRIGSTRSFITLFGKQFNIHWHYNIFKGVP